MHPATRHIKRLQDENRCLREALSHERKYRQELRRWYGRRLRSRFMWMVDLLFLTAEERSQATRDILHGSKN